MRFKPPAAFLLLVLARPCLAQQIPDLPDRDAKNAAVKDAARLRVEAGRNALAAKNAPEAVQHFSNALWWDPFSPAVLGELLEAASESDDAQALWASQLVAATADERGALEPEGTLKKVLAREPHLAKLAVARAEAAAQLAAAAKDFRAKDGDHAILARWMLPLACELVAGSPALRRRHAAVFSQPLAPALPDHRPVLAALKEVMDKSLGEQRPEAAIRAAQCLLGFASQARFKDLEGPKAPAIDSVAMAARAGMARAREQIEARRKSPIPTISDLEAMSKEEREKFTRDHAGFDDPGVTLSPTGRYRIETSCGHATLLGVAKTIELHHARLAKHFGQDPFTGQPGIVRVVPESSGLENEGTPYWWAGGFQSGSVTTVKFTSGTIGGLGHGLTHELTHRFDGALNPGIPAWLAEGRAVWTGGAFGAAEDAGFVENHASFGTVEDAYLKGYGDENNLKKLVEGTIEDYRHNYTAGYALYLYLASWKDKDAPLFAERLVRFERGCKEKGGNSLEWFTSCFCDGKAGRPKDLKGFAEKFGEFVRGFYWQSRASWTSRYTQKRPPPGEDPYVYDAPTWHESRNRAEPWFGQDHARIAGEILIEAGRKREAAAALEWSLLVDEWRPEIVERLARLLDQENRQAAAWAVRNEGARRFLAPAPQAPMPPDVARVASKTVALVELLAAAHKAAGAAKPLCAAAFAADHDRLAARVAAKPLGAAPAAMPKVALHPLDEPPRSLGLLGWEEDKLTDYEERRVKDLWYEVPEGDLHVGRSKPREGTGTMDRSAHQRHAFVRTREWLPAGRWVLTARIQCTTSFTAGAVIVGYSRRDRHVRVGFSGGDFLYSIGAKEDKTEFEAIDASLQGLKEREWTLWGANPHKHVKFDPPANTFTLRVLVDGPDVRAYVNDDLIGTYRSPDGQAVEGHIGFAASQGAYLVGAPTIHRRDRSAAAGGDPAWPRGLDPAVAGRQTARDVLNLACRGIATTPTGALALWIPELPPRPDGTPAAAADYMEIATGVAFGLDQALEEDSKATPFVVYLPESVGNDGKDLVARYLKEHVARVSAILTHRHAAPLSTIQEGDKDTARPAPTVLFLDPRGVLRVAERFERGQRSLSHSLKQWLSVFEALATARKSPTDVKGP
jgi:hypothetical protein